MTEWTDTERAEIATEYDQRAADLWTQVETAEEAGKDHLAARLRAFACDSEDVAAAARISSARLARFY